MANLTSTIEMADVGSTPRRIERKFEPEEIDLAGEAELDSDLELQAEAVMRGEKLHLSGSIAALAAMDCTRCLKRLLRPVEVSFEVVFVDALNERLDAELEIKEADLDESYVENGRIDMREVVREQVLLSLPEQVLCSTDCKGLCPKCGVDRNLLDCKCADDDIDPRWAALKNLR